MIYFEMLVVAAAVAGLIIATRRLFRRGPTWTETSYYQWVRATRRGERTTTTRVAHGTRYWVLE